MAKILVKKSAPKGVLVKQVQPQLMQMPKEGKTFGQFYNVFRNKNKTPGVGVKQRLAGLLGMVGKIGAGISTAQQTANAMQGGNLSAPLSAGYTYESLDPTGRKISEAANPNPQPTPRAKVEQVPLPAAPAPTPAAPTMPPMPPPLPAAPAAPAPAPTTMPQLTGHPTIPSQSNFTGVPPGMPPPPPGMPPPPPPGSPLLPQPPQPVNQSMTTQTQQYAPVPPYAGAMTTQTQEQIAQANNALKTNEQIAAEQAQTQYAQVPSYAGVVTNLPPTDTDKKSFVTALTEKLGADIVYKMTPHEMGTFAAYTLLKLR